MLPLLLELLLVLLELGVLLFQFVAPLLQFGARLGPVAAGEFSLGDLLLDRAELRAEFLDLFVLRRQRLVERLLLGDPLLLALAGFLQELLHLVEQFSQLLILQRTRRTSDCD